MERLISSSPLHSQTPLSRPRPLLFGVPSKARYNLPFFPRHGSFKPVASLFFKSPGRVSVPRYEEQARRARPCRQLASGRELAVLFPQKVASALVYIIVSAFIVIIIQPILAPPAYATMQSAAKTSGRLIRNELLNSAWTGFFAGCLHTLSGPDHLAALAPLSIGRSKMESAIVGALWGCGHDAGQVIFGLLFLMLKDRLHIEVIRTWGTRIVGLTLLVIGAVGIREASEVPTPCIALDNGECDVSIIEPLDAGTSGRKNLGFATVATGIVHGLQPDALMMVMPALALPSRLAGAAFLGIILLKVSLATMCIKWSLVEMFKLSLLPGFIEPSA
ncbi:chloroplast protein FOR GROWTH AND FERTILITY 2 isoform X2 [Elaeis guineensis]|uniref:Uncharacterized protein LOC105055110 isoform X2 n=1 Tax=Elaeis guineensis var. tenera TaxID=51953 RepID=A0A8N4F920_ELAGV|nr:uncharacterized protein LOC105055110 isoform X2 [Elaeis guineensis]